MLSTASITPPASTWLENFPALHGIADPAWLEAVYAAREVTVPAGTVVLHKGEPCRSFLMVTHGSLRVYGNAENGREILLYRVHPGEVCVLMLTNLLEQSGYSAQVVAEEDVCAISIPMPNFQKALAQSKAFGAHILSMAARRLGEVMLLVERVAFEPLELRLARLLRQLFERRNTTRLLITHQELAGELGSTREVISRMLKEFERRGCIHLHRGHIDLLSRSALARLSRDA